MRVHRTPVRRRGGFTLIELLVVMAIIAVLISLTTAAVYSAYERLSELQCRNEETGLDTALRQFQADFNNPGPPPSRIWLDGSGPTAYQNPPPGYTAAQVQQLAIDSQAYLRKVWPHIQINGAGGIPWNSGVQGRSNNVILEGEEALVFWLGGAAVPDPTNGQMVFSGFSADTTNPMNPNTAIKRKGPYFEFKTARIATGLTGSGFPVYVDTYGSGVGVGLKGQPYAYFSSGKTANGYNAYAALIGYDCKTLTTVTANGPVSIQPYSQPVAAGQAVQYYNPDKYQIISAGKNQLFGPGGTWTALNPTAIGKDGSDDLSNFTPRRLGAPQ